MKHWHYAALLSSQPWLPLCIESVLPIPGLNSSVRPDEPSRPVGARVTITIKQRLPVIRPLAVDVVLSGLPRARGGKQNAPGVFRKARYQVCGAFRWEMF